MWISLPGLLGSRAKSLTRVLQSFTAQQPQRVNIHATYTHLIIYLVGHIINLCWASCLAIQKAYRVSEQKVLDLK